MKKNSYKLHPCIDLNSHEKWINIPIYGFLLLVCLLAFLLTPGCVQSNSDILTKEGLTIACTIPPQEEFIRAVAGESNVSVLVMVPPGASPHTFEPTPSRIAELESADLYLSLGSGIEFENRWIDRIHKLYPELTIVNTSRTMTLLSGNEHHHDEDMTHENELEEVDEKKEATDPHVWLSPGNAATIVRETCDAMSVKRPELKESFQKNRDAYLEQLSRVDLNIRQSLEDLPSRTILVYHPAFGYFCQDYNLTQMAVEDDGHEPSAKALAELITKAKALEIRLVFTEPEVSTREAQTLAKELNGTLVLISPLAENYLENMQDIAYKIAG